jgi:hypothetical protein
VVGPKNSPIQASATACMSNATVIGSPGPTLSTQRPAGGSNTMQIPVVIKMTLAALPGLYPRTLMKYSDPTKTRNGM